MFITFEMYEKMRNEGILDVSTNLNELQYVKDNLMKSYNINKIEDLVPLLFDFEINRILNIFKYTPFEYLRTFYVMDHSVQFIYDFLRQDMFDCMDLIVCGLYDIIFFKCKLYYKFEYLKEWVDEAIWYYNETVKTEQEEEDDFNKEYDDSAFKTSETNSPVILKMIEYIKTKYENKTEYIKKGIDDDSFCYYIESEMFNYVAGL